MLIEKLQRLDEELTLFINSLHNGVTDQLMQFMSDKMVWLPLYGLALYFMIRRLGWKRAIVAVFAIALVFALCDIMANLVKDSVARLRPCYNGHMLDGKLHMLERRGGFYGFYSAHAANSFGFAVTCSRMFRLDRSRKYILFRVAIFCWAILLSLSRVFVGKHFLGDVMTGGLAGIITGFALSAIACRIAGRIKGPGASFPSSSPSNP